MVKDADALPLLIGVMEAAGFHDGPECERLLDEAIATLPSRFHQSRAGIECARQGVAARDWEQVWRQAYGATQTLTWAFSPDFRVCPPMPEPEPFSRSARTCAAGHQIGSPGARFCPMCGMALD